MKNYQNFYLKIFILLVVKFSTYLNRRVFVMSAVSVRQIDVIIKRCERRLN